MLPVRCPRCDADLTVGRELLNRPVECGSCGKAFVPIADPGGREPDDLPPRPKKGGGGAAFGVLSLVLGLLSVVLCCLGPVGVILSGGAVVAGLIGLRSRDGRGLAIAGLVVGLVTLVLRVLAALFGVGRGAFDLF
jgi:hypothetical protein